MVLQESNLPRKCVIKYWANELLVPESAGIAGKLHYLEQNYFQLMKYFNSFRECTNGINTGNFKIQSNLGRILLRLLLGYFSKWD